MVAVGADNQEAGSKWLGEEGDEVEGDWAVLLAATKP
jgi:hypothetical protein